MVKWFLIGCGIVAVMSGIPVIWDKLEIDVQEKVRTAMAFLVLSGLTGFMAWFLYAGITS